MTGLATQKQIDYIVTLANRRYGCQARYLSQCRSQLGLSSFGVQRLTKAEASAIIDRIK